VDISSKRKRWKGIGEKHPEKGGGLVAFGTPQDEKWARTLKTGKLRA